VTYLPVTDEEAIDSFLYLSRKEGILPALESAHAIALARKIAKDLETDEILIINLSGRGDKDVEQVARVLEGGHGLR
jgi:tryptophan synthase beta chain